MEHELIPIPSRYRFLLHLLAGMCLGILANCSGDSNLDLYSIQTFLGDINRLVFNNFFDEEMKKVDEIVLNQANNRRNNQNNKHMEIKIKKCNDVRNYDIHVIIALKQYRLYHSNDTASLAWLQVSLFTWLAIPV